MRRGVAVGLTPVPSARDDVPGIIENDRAYRYVPARTRRFRLSERCPHRGLERCFVAGDQTARHCGKNPSGAKGGIECAFHGRSESEPHRDGLHRILDVVPGVVLGVEVQAAADGREIHLVEAEIRED